MYFTGTVHSVVVWLLAKIIKRALELTGINLCRPSIENPLSEPTQTPSNTHSTCGILVLKLGVLPGLVDIPVSLISPHLGKCIIIHVHNIQYTILYHMPFILTMKKK